MTTALTHSSTGKTGKFSGPGPHLMPPPPPRPTIREFDDASVWHEHLQNIHTLTQKIKALKQSDGANGAQPWETPKEIVEALAAKYHFPQGEAKRYLGLSPPLNAYQIFSREILRNCTFPETVSDQHERYKIIGSLWKGLSYEQQKVWNVKAVSEAGGRGCVWY